MSLPRRPISKAGYRNLQEEMDHLTRVERPSVIKEIEIAIGHGDLSENAEYTYGKEKQALIETRIRSLQERLAASEVIDLDKRPDSDRVIFGTKVKIEDVDTGKIREYTILGADEVDIPAGIISVTSPMGKALIGKEDGDAVEVKTPDGIKEYEIIEIS